MAKDNTKKCEGKSNGFLLLLKDLRLTIILIITLVGIVIGATVGWMDLQAQADEAVKDIKAVKEKHKVDITTVTAALTKITGLLEKMSEKQDKRHEETTKVQAKMDKIIGEIKVDIRWMKRTANSGRRARSLPDHDNEGGGR